MVLADGSVTGSSSKDGPRVMIVDTEDGSTTEVEEQRSDDEIVGWVLSCICAPNESWESPTHWTGLRWSRAATASAEDVAGGRIYADAGTAMDVDGRDDVRELAHLAWREHCGTAGALRDIRAAKDAIANNERKLMEAVRLSRAAGHSWDQIGRAAGMTRQSAHARWSSFDA